jgi:hypothetical protein
LEHERKARPRFVDFVQSTPTADLAADIGGDGTPAPTPIPNDRDPFGAA